MQLYLLQQDENCGYDTYDSCVVVAETEDDARLINPDGKWGRTWTAWCKKPEEVAVTELGEAAYGLKGGTVVCASFNAG